MISVFLIVQFGGNKFQIKADEIFIAFE